MYRTEVEKLLNVIRWSSPEAWYTIRELTRTVKGPSMMHYNAMLRVMRYTALIFNIPPQPLSVD